MTNFVLISDTHCQLNKIDVPSGDILIHSGDLTYRGTLPEIIPELNSLEKLKVKFKDIILICGNHDFLGEREPSLMAQLCKERGLIYLNHASIEVQGFKIFGSPYTPYFGGWAYNIPRGQPIKDKWAHIPMGLDILITHGPPQGILDKTPEGESVGCQELLERIKITKPKLHVFGHIHSQNGIIYKARTFFVNASICNEEYQCENPIRLFSIDNPKSMFFVYGLVDPRNNLVRYVGKSCSGMGRPLQHFYGKELSTTTKKSSWVKSLIAKNLFPYIKVLEECEDDASVSKAEIEHIEKLKCNKLLNMTSGGTGGDTGGGQKRRRKVISKEISTGVIKEYQSIIKTNADGFSSNKVVAVCKGRRKSHKGYKFWYKENQEIDKPSLAMVPLKATNLNTKEVLNFIKCKDAMSFFNISEYQLSSAIERKKILNGFLIERNAVIKRRKHAQSKQ